MHYIVVRPSVRKSAESFELHFNFNSELCAWPWATQQCPIVRQVAYSDAALIKDNTPGCAAPLIFTERITFNNFELGNFLEYYFSLTSNNSCESLLVLQFATKMYTLSNDFRSVVVDENVLKGGYL